MHTDVKVIHYHGQPISLHGRRGDPYFDEISVAAAGEFFELAISCLNPESSIVLDVGANIGLTSMMLSTQAREVHAFEPSPQTYDSFLKTIRANNATNVIARQIAIGSKQGTVGLMEDQLSASANHLLTQDTLARKSTLKTPITTIDSYINDNNILSLDFIKLDIEGFEIDALYGSKETFEKFRPTVLTEFNSFAMIGFHNLNPRDYLNFLKLTFPYVYELRNNSPFELDDDGKELTFLHDHLTGEGCVSDLLCTFRPLE